MTAAAPPRPRGRDAAGPSKRAILFHPETQHAYQTALALQEAGLLDCFLTGFYYKPDSLAGRLMNFAPGAVGERLRRYMRRRTMLGLDARLVRSHPLLALALRATGRSRLASRLAPTAVRQERNVFEALAASLIRRRRPKGVICYDTNALAPLRAARSVRAHGILDQTTGHLTRSIRIWAEEAALQPDFADSIPHDQPAGNIERCRAEALAADWVLAPSDYVRDSLREIGVAAERIVMLPYGVDVERFSPPAERPLGRFRVLFVGGVGQTKGVKYLLEAMKRLALPGAELMLVGGIVGSGRGLEPYAGGFTHVPQLPRDAVAARYREADIFVLPTLHEGSAIAVFEAMASGMPVITTPNAGSAVRDGVEGFIVPIRDVDALMERIERLYRDPALRLDMGERARARALDFTWEHYRRRLAAWFTSLPPRAD